MAYTSLTATSFTASTSAFTKLSDALDDAGIPDAVNNSVMGYDGYILNRSTSIALYVGTGTTSPTSYATLSPLTALKIAKGANLNTTWVKAATADSPVTVDFVDGGEYQGTTIDGVIGTITLNSDEVPKGDGSGNLVASSITDNGDTITIASADVSVSGGITAASLTSTGAIASSSPTNGIGYASGTGVAGTQASSRTTTIVANGICGSLTLVSAAGSTTPASATVTNSAVAATDVVIVSQKSGTDKYDIGVSAVADGSFQITFRTYSGTTTEQPVFNFAILRAGTAA